MPASPTPCSTPTRTASCVPAPVEEPAEVESVDEAAAAGETEATDAERDDSVDDAATAAGRPEPRAAHVHRSVEVPAAKAYAFRLVVTRKLYDHGTLVQQAPPRRARLAVAAVPRLHPADFDAPRRRVRRTGSRSVSHGRDRSSPRRSPTPACPRGVAAIAA